MNDRKGTWKVKAGLAEMLKGGVIMDVVTAEQAKIAEDAGAVAVMALERVPADIRREGGVARMSDPGLITAIIDAVTIPVMAKCRIGHFVEAQILESLGVDYIDESEVLTPADEEHHINKHPFKVPFVCGCRDLGEALRRITEGAAMIRTKGEAGTGNVVEAVRHMRAVTGGIRKLHGMGSEELVVEAKRIGAPTDLLEETARLGRLPGGNCAAGGIATDLENVDALILPGGESTTMARLMEPALRDSIQRRVAAGMPVMGTCAGMILMARDVKGGRMDQEPLQLMDIGVRRNAYGRQIDSFEAEVESHAIGGAVPAVFIRAPQLVQHGDSVEELARHGDQVVAVRQGNRLALAFHPELTPDRRWHQYFLTFNGEKR